MYKFYAKPLQEVFSKKNNKMMFRFDTKGEFITDDQEIIKRAKGYFDCIELKAEEVGDKIKGNAPKRVLTIATKDDKPAEKSDDEIRQLAKEKGIKSWHVKSIDKLKKELEA